MTNSRVITQIDFVKKEEDLSSENGPSFDILAELKDCQAIRAQISERLDRLVEDFQSGKASVPVWSLDKLETDSRDLAERFRKIALVLRVL